MLPAVFICTVSISLETTSGMSCTTMGVVSAAEWRTTSLMASNACVCSCVCSAPSTGRPACRAAAVMGRRQGGGSRGRDRQAGGVPGAAAQAVQSRQAGRAGTRTTARIKGASSTYRLQQRRHHILEVRGHGAGAVHLREAGRQVADGVADLHMRGQRWHEFGGRPVMEVSITMYQVPAVPAMAPDVSFTAHQAPAEPTHARQPQLLKRPPSQR